MNKTMEFKNHDLVEAPSYEGIRIEHIPVKDPGGAVVEGLHATRIVLDNPKQLNSYTTQMVKGVILGMRQASNDRACKGASLFK